MHIVTEYRKHAEKCCELANFTAEPADKQILERLAETWEKLADLRKRDREPEPNRKFGIPLAGGVISTRGGPPPAYI